MGERHGFAAELISPTNSTLPFGLISLRVRVYYDQANLRKAKNVANRRSILLCRHRIGVLYLGSDPGRQLGRREIRGGALRGSLWTARRNWGVSSGGSTDHSVSKEGEILINWPLEAGSLHPEQEQNSDDGWAAGRIHRVLLNDRRYRNHGVCRSHNRDILWRTHPFYGPAQLWR